MKHDLNKSILILDYTVIYQYRYCIGSDFRTGKARKSDRHTMDTMDTPFTYGTGMNLQYDELVFT
jgi:hypothetical protein